MDRKIDSYAVPEGELLSHLQSDMALGLTQQQVAWIRAQWGKNELPSGVIRPLWWVFIQQFRNPLIYLLLCAAVLIFVIGHSKADVFIISGILLFNAIIGTIQEGRTRAILQRLSKLVRADCTVVRNGKQQLISDRELVPGDIIVISRGDRVPADGRILDSYGLRIDQALLTGESMPVKKQSGMAFSGTALIDRLNMVYKGTIVTSGKARVLVTATGVHTEIGILGTVAQSIQTDAPIQAELYRLSYVVLFVIVVLCGALLFIGLALGRSFLDLLAMIAALFICVVPEGLPVVLTLVLVRGAYQLAQHNVLVRRMQAVEGLGRTSIIVMDKTGTLTLNQMMVSNICTPLGTFHVSGSGYDIGGRIEPLIESEQMQLMQLLALNGYLLNSADLFFSNGGQSRIKGDPTEAALAIASYKIDPEIVAHAAMYRQLFHMPFHSELRLHVGGYEQEGVGVLMVNGAPEEVIRHCGEGGIVEQRCIKTLFDDGLRLIGCAYAHCSLQELQRAKGDVETYVKTKLPPLSFLGVCGIHDAVRPDAKKSIAAAKQAGITVIMATGDHRKTALSVARQTGLSNSLDEVITGAELEGLSDQDLAKLLERVRIFARMVPGDKLRLVRVLQARGNIVAMTGDGVNDVPSIVAADLGIAMGQTGADVTKYAADMVLYDDSFSNVLYAVLVGRHVFYTLQRVILYFFSTNLAEILIMLCALLFSIPFPLTIAHILWLNLVTDGFLDTGLSFEPMDRLLLKKGSWLGTAHTLISAKTVLLSLYLAVPMALGSLLIFLRHLGESVVLARTMALVSMAMFQWFNAWNCRSLNRSLFSLRLLGNPYLIAATAFVMLLQLFVVYSPFMQHFFQTVSLSAHQWAEIVLVSSTIIVWDEIRKLIFK